MFYKNDYNPVSTHTRTRPEMDRKAKALNCKARYADERTLQLDLDGHGALPRFVRLYNIAQEQGLLLGSYISGMWTSRSGSGFHVEIRLIEDMPVEQRVMYQALLGSDEVREILNLTKQRDTIVLFRPNQPVK